MSAIKTELLFLNHASVLIRYEDQYLLTDPWYQKPAFGSWLPLPPLAVHPAYLAALGHNLRIIISHAHDDHCDEDFLKLFSHQTSFFTANFTSPGVRNRLGLLGFENITAVDRNAEVSGPFKIKSYIQKTLTPDDAIYTIETPDAFIIHANDNWAPLPDDILQSIKTDVSRKGSGQSLYMSQTNSASGFPLTYVDFSYEEKQQLLQNKIRLMSEAGLKNARKTGAKYFMGYAGFSGVFVKDHPEYLADSFFKHFLTDVMKIAIPEGIDFLDMYPGDTFNFSQLRKSFLNTAISDDSLKSAAIRYYQLYGVDRAQCDSYLCDQDSLSREEVIRKLRLFLDSFNAFVIKKVRETNYQNTILGKVLMIEISDYGLRLFVKFGEGLVETEEYDKKIIVSSKILSRVLSGAAWFENLYTGFEAEFSRRPRDTYHRDIISYMTMFSYVYKNRTLPSLVSSEASI